MASQLVPYLSFPGTAREAMTFYADIFGGSLDIVTFGDFKLVPPEHESANKVMHSQLTAGIVSLAGADAIDAMTPHSLVRGNDVALAFMGEDEPLLRGYFDRLADGGEVEMPLDKQMWGDLYGALVDKFGVRWMVNIAQPGGYAQG